MKTRKVIAFLMALAMAFALAACTRNATVEEPAAEPEAQEPEIIYDIPEDQELSMEDIFNSVSSGLMKMSDYDDEEDSKMDASYNKPSKKKKKKKGIEIEYDPDSDSTMVRRKHKRGDDDWGW